MMKRIYAVIAVLTITILITGFSLLKKNNYESMATTKIYKSSELFTERDLVQDVDIESAEEYIVESNKNISITSAGVYAISGTASNVTIYIEAGDDDKVQIVLNNLNIENEKMPCIYIKSASKVFVTSLESNSLKVSGNFIDDGSTSLNAVIFSKQDLILNGSGTLNIESSKNGITGKDDIKITGGTYNIKSNVVAIRANDSIRIADCILNIDAGTDGLHSENGSDDTKGYIYICGGNISINANDDCIHGEAVVQIDDGNIKLDGDEGIEGTYVQINGGTIEIKATGDGINAGKKSESYSVVIEITGGDITIDMADGDTDGIDSNGDLIISGGKISINAIGAFDYDGELSFTGGIVIINGEQVGGLI